MEIQKILRSKGSGFTLVELVIVIAIVIVLSVVSVPIYRSYVDKAKMAEGYALLGTILSAQKAYYSEHGNFLLQKTVWDWTSYDSVLGVDARGNKYFTVFAYSKVEDPTVWTRLLVKEPEEFRNEKKDCLELRYYLETGGTWLEVKGSNI